MPDDWGGFLQLSATMICRSVVFFGLNTFIALYWMSRRGTTASEATSILSVLLGTVLVATVLGGVLADRIGRRTTIRSGLGLATLMLPLFLACSDGPYAIPALVALAMTFFLPSSVLVVLGQEYLPNRVGIASGVTLGLAVSVGGMVAPLLGWLADRRGVGTVMLVLETVLVIAAVQTFFLPTPPHATAERSSTSS